MDDSQISNRFIAFIQYTLETDKMRVLTIIFKYDDDTAQLKFASFKLFSGEWRVCGYGGRQALAPALLTGCFWAASASSPASGALLYVPAIPHT